MSSDFIPRRVIDVGGAVPAKVITLPATPENQNQTAYFDNPGADPFNVADCYPPSVFEKAPMLRTYVQGHYQWPAGVKIDFSFTPQFMNSSGGVTNMGGALSGTVYGNLYPKYLNTESSGAEWASECRNNTLFWLGDRQTFTIAVNDPYTDGTTSGTFSAIPVIVFYVEFSPGSATHASYVAPGGVWEYPATNPFAAHGGISFVRAALALVCIADLTGGLVDLSSGDWGFAAETDQPCPFHSFEVPFGIPLAAPWGDSPPLTSVLVGFTSTTGSDWGGFLQSPTAGYQPLLGTFNSASPGYPSPGSLTEGESFLYFGVGSLTVTPICDACDLGPTTNFQTLDVVVGVDLKGPGINGATRLPFVTVNCCPGSGSGSGSGTGPPCTSSALMLGTSGTYVAPFTGTLYVLFNDTFNAYGDNTGDFNLNWPTGTITVPGNDYPGVAIAVTQGTSYPYTAGGLIDNGTGTLFGPNGNASHDSVSQWTPVPLASYGSLVGIFVCPSVANTCLYNTGQMVTANGFTSGAASPCDQDNEWTYNGSPAALPSTGFYTGGTNYRWISPQCDGNGMNTSAGNLFATQFAIPSNASSFSLSGQTSADNWVDSIAVNGTKIDIGLFSTAAGVYGTTTGFTSVAAYCAANPGVALPVFEFNTLNPFTIPAGSGFVVGTNTITFAVGEASDTFGGLAVIWSSPCT